MDSLPVHYTVILCTKGAWWVCAVYNLQIWGLQYRHLCFSSPPTCHCSVKRISWSGTGTLRDVPTPPRGWARNKIRWHALLRLCPTCGNGILDSIAAGVPVHGRVRRRRNVCLSGVDDWRCKEVDTCFFSNELGRNKFIDMITDNTPETEKYSHLSKYDTNKSSG